MIADMANKRDAIIDAAIGRISEEGGGFSTAQIAADAGCSQSLVFRYFDTKEGLMSACFERVCHELLQTLRGVAVPKDPDTDSVRAFMMDVWRAYCGYLESNTHMAKAYLFFVGRGRRFPKGYRRAEDVLRRILGDSHRVLRAAYPDFDFVAEYLIMFSYAAATGLFIDHAEDPETVLGKIEGILRYGICGYGGRVT